MPNMKGFALVAHTGLSKKFFATEISFMKDIKVALFHSLEEAQKWTESIC